MKRSKESPALSVPCCERRSSLQSALHNSTRGDRLLNPGRDMQGSSGGTCHSFLLPLAVLLIFVSISVRSSTAKDVDLSSAKDQPVAYAVPVDHAPALDGTLADPLWELAKPISDFRQHEPYEGNPATEKTEVRILYSQHEVYFGIACFDSDPSGIVATQLRRDVSQELDDYFEIIIDSAHDRRNAYVFQVNPLGTQRDALITDEQVSNGGDGDSGWDGVWTSEARIGPEGWTATIGIPFSTLNFMHSRDVVWGLNLKRFILRKNEEDVWAAWQRNYGAAKISEAGELHSISEIGSSRLFVVKPYGLTGFTHFPPNVAGTGLNPGTSALYTGGLDVKLGLRSNLVANLTANTDFADADVDTQQFNLTPYKLFYPEKRPFFLENSRVFNFPLGGDTGDLLFFSRQIGIDPVTGQEVPVNGGARISGSLGHYEVGLMDVETRKSGPNPHVNYGVVRVKRSLWTGSYIGLMGIDRRSGSVQDPSNRSEGIDTRLLFFKDLTVLGWAARTRSPGVHSGNSDVGADLHYQANWLDFEARKQKIGANFDPEVGFLERNDANESFIDADFRQFPNTHGVRELQYDGFLSHSLDMSGAFQLQQWQARFRADFNNGAYTDDDPLNVTIQRIVQPFNVYRNVVIPPGLYHFVRHKVSFGSATNHRLTYELKDWFGGYYSGRLNEASVQGTYRPNARLAVELNNTWDRFRLPQRNFSVDVASAEADYSFSRLLSLSTILQLDTANTQAVSANIRLRFNYRPDSDLFVIYNQGTQFASLAAANPPQIRGARLSIKFTYSFSP